jgi:predicted hydrocarbon binding protein
MTTLNGLNGAGQGNMPDPLKYLRTQKARSEIRDTIQVVPGPQPVRHNHYYDERFYHQDRASGVLRNVYGQRVVRVTEDFILGLLAGLEEEVGEAAGEIMYKAGYQWGLEDMKSFVPRVQQEFEVQFSKMGMGMMLETWWWPLQIEGWGGWRYDFRQGKQGLIFIDLYESAVAQSMGNVGKVMCYFYAGLFAAVFSLLSKKELACIEIQCYSMGEDFCKFLISTNKRVNAAAFWRSEGATSADIMKKVKDVL